MAAKDIRAERSPQPAVARQSREQERVARQIGKDEWQTSELSQVAPICLDSQKSGKPRYRYGPPWLARNPVDLDSLSVQPGNDRSVKGWRGAPEPKNLRHRWESSLR